MEDKNKTKEATSNSLLEDGSLSPAAEAKIQENAKKLIADKKARKVYPIIVFGDTDLGEKECYVGYFGEPTFPQFSKFIAAGKKDETLALKTLAKDTFIEGDRDLVDNDSLFLYGTMGQIGMVTSLRQSFIVNL